MQEKYSCRVLALLPTGAPVLLSAVPPPTPMPPPGTRAPSSPLSKPTSPRDCSPEELWVSSQLFDSRQPLNIEDIPVSPILLKSSLFNSEILLCQSPTLNFFFIVSTHIFLKCLCSPWSVSNPATPDSEVPIGLRGLFSPIRLSPVNHWGIWHSLVSFTPATEQLNTLSCRPGADI